MQLPESFIERMKHLLGNEADSFFVTYRDSRHYGLRINTLKWSVEEAKKVLPFHLTPIDWVEEGFYYDEEDRPAKHPYYHAGLYYIQEPSAMAPASTIPIQPGDRVLDLCAAPGGKSTQVAARLQGEGVLVSNDISSERVKALVKNIELFGIHNALITNETPDRLAQVFEHFFDKILIDAPCSGEGMFRKNPEMVHSWESHNIDRCVVMQKDILQEAAKMLRPGGMILYSTCTFAPEENERQVAHFLEQHKDFELAPIELKHGFQPGKREWLGQGQKATYPVEKTARLWPQHIKGEGHFLALIQKRHEADTTEPKHRRIVKSTDTIKEKELVDFRTFEKETFTRPLQHMIAGELVSFKGHLYLRPTQLPPLKGLKIIKSGWYLGELKKNRFEPSQALAMGLRAEDVIEPIHFSTHDEDLVRYLKGETIHREGKKGWKLICVDGHPLGWAKQVQGILKNAYPPGWRLIN